jgi:mutator protein MutT
MTFMPARQNPELIDVSAGLVFRDGKLLITQRRPKDHLAGLWEFPGGKREAGESGPDCLIRELTEELGIKVRVGRLVETVVHHYPEISVRLEFYRCELLEGEPRAIGCQALQWVTSNQLDDFSFPEADGHLLAMLKAAPALWRDAGPTMPL